MIENLGQITTADLEAIFEERRHGLTEAQFRQTRVPLDYLKTAPRVFQPRLADERRGAKKAHIAELVRSIRQHGALDPMIVFPVAGERIVVDGHCRLEAYRKAGRHLSVPVRYLKGSFKDALLMSASANSRDKLSLTKREKLEKAWQLVLYNESRKCFSTRDIERATGASKSTVANMGKALSEAKDFDPRGMTWDQVKRERLGDFEYSKGWFEQLVADIEDGLGRAFGATPAHQPEAWLTAFGNKYPALFEAILDHAAATYWDEVEDMVREHAADNGERWVDL